MPESLPQKPPKSHKSYMWFIPTYTCFLLISPLLKLAIASLKTDSFKYYLITLLCILLFLYFALGDAGCVIRFCPQLMGIDVSGLYEFFFFETPVGMMLAYAILGAFLHLKRDVVTRIKGSFFICMIVVGLIWLWLRWGIESSLAGANWDSVLNGYYSVDGLFVTAGLFCLIKKLEPTAGRLPKRVIRLVGEVSRSTLEIYYIHWIVGYTVLSLISPLLIDLFAAVPVLATYIKGTLLVLACLGVVNILKRVPLIKHLAR